MRSRILIGMLVLMLFVPFASAITTFTIDAPDIMQINQATTINFTVTDTTGFDGTVYVTYLRIDSSQQIISFANGSFSSGVLVESWGVTPNQAGDYAIYGNLTNAQGVTLQTFNKTGTVNGSEPNVIDSAPSGTITDADVELEIETDRDATCRYDTTDDDYGDMSNFDQSAGRFHNHSLGSLSEGSHIYYVRCKAAAGGAEMSSSEIVQFTVEEAPSAEITLSDPSPVKAGTIQIDLRISEDLDEVPSLTYIFDDDPGKINQISLTGEGQKWKGYMIITSDDDNRAGTFFFEGKNSQGRIGTRITNDNLFVVDTSKPPAPVNAKAETLQSGSVRLKWFYDGEEVDHYNIYRLSSTGVNYVDFIAEAESNESYTDARVNDKVTYYYRVAAVDRAGNVGPLSEEVFATALTGVKNDPISINADEPIVEEEPQVLPPNLVTVVEDFENRVDTVILDLETIETNLGNKDPETKQLLDEMDILTQVRNSKDRAREMKNTLIEYKDVYATEQELSQKLQVVETDLEKLKESTPRDFSLSEKSNVVQTVSDEDVKVAATELLSNLGLTQDEIENYVKINQRKKDKSRIETTAFYVLVTFMDSSTSERTLIKKLLTYEDPEPLSDVVVVEMIPKTSAATASEINFINKRHEVLNDDPIVKFGFLEFDYQGENLVYSFSTWIPAEDVKNLKSVVLLSLNTLASEPSKIIGLSVLPDFGLTEGQSMIVWVGIFMIMTLLLYYMVFVRDVGVSVTRSVRHLSVQNMWEAIKNNVHRGGRVVKDPFAPRHRASSKFDTHQDLLHQLSKDAPPPMHADPVVAHQTMIRLEKVHTMLTQADEWLDKGKISEASKLYPHISMMYQGLPKEHKNGVFNRCNKLHQRISQSKNS